MRVMRLGLLLSELLVVLFLLLLFVRFSTLRIFQLNDIQHLIPKLFDRLSGRFKFVRVERSGAVRFLLTFDDQINACTICRERKKTIDADAKAFFV